MKRKLTNLLGRGNLPSSPSLDIPPALRELSDLPGVDVQFPWETQPQRNHRKLLDLGPLLMDRDLVPW